MIFLFDNGSKQLKKTKLRIALNTNYTNWREIDLKLIHEIHPK